MVKRRAQSTLEYAALIAVVVAGIIAMQTYFKRGLEGKVKSSADDIGTQYDIEKGGYHYKNKLEGDRIEVSVLGDNINLPEAGIGQGITKRYTDGAYKVKVGEQITTDKAANLGW